MEKSSTVGLAGMEGAFELYMEDIGLLEDAHLAGMVVDLVVVVRVGDGEDSSALLVVPSVVGLLKLLEAT